MAQTDLMKKLKETEEALKANEMITKELQKSAKDRMVEGRQTQINFLNTKVDTSKPHISNINEDPMLTARILHGFEFRDEIHVGRKNGDPKPHIIISAIGIKPNHAKIVKKGDIVTLEPMSEETSEYIRLNGEKVYEPTRLFHLDRLVFGTSTTFLFKDPQLAQFKRINVEEKDIDLEYCQNEVSKVEQLDDFLNDMDDEEVVA